MGIANCYMGSGRASWVTGEKIISGQGCSKTRCHQLNCSLCDNRCSHYVTSMSWMSPFVTGWCIFQVDILCNEEILGKDHTLKFISVTRWRIKVGVETGVM